VVLGGLGSITGSVLAACVLSFGRELLRDFQQFQMVTYALLLIVLMLVRPQGIFGTRELWDLGPFRRLPRPKLSAASAATGASPTEVRDDSTPGGRP
jgi:branched-chain amino acid transport system permease protein